MSDYIKTLYILILKYGHRATVTKVNGNNYTILVREVASSNKGPIHKMEITLTPDEDFVSPSSFKWPS